MRTMRLWVQSLALHSRLRIRHCHELWCRSQIPHCCGSDSALLWPWHRPVTAALAQPLAWELPNTEGVALKRQKKKKKIRYSNHIMVTGLIFWVLIDIYWSIYKRNAMLFGDFCRIICEGRDQTGIQMTPEWNDSGVNCPSWIKIYGGSLYSLLNMYIQFKLSIKKFK